ncbi:hypothetical protein GCM10027521_17780 [Amycolatopsis cihanbeyliensis]
MTEVSFHESVTVLPVIGVSSTTLSRKPVNRQRSGGRPPNSGEIRAEPRSMPTTYNAALREIYRTAIETNGPYGCIERHAGFDLR